MTCLVELLCWFKNTLEHYNKAYSDDSHSALKSCFNLARVQPTQSLIAAVIKVYIPLIWTRRVLYQNHSRLGLPFYARQHVSSVMEKAEVLQTAKQHFAPRFQVPFEEITPEHESILFFPPSYPNPACICLKRRSSDGGK